MRYSEIQANAAGQQTPAKRVDLDRVGMTASLLCAVHCALMPLVVTLLPLLGLSFLANEATEWSLIGLSMLFGVSSLCLGFRRHRYRRALFLLAGGFALLATGRIAERNSNERLGVVLVVCGGVTVACAHLLNRRLCHSCERCNPESGCEPIAVRDGDKET